MVLCIVCVSFTFHVTQLQLLQHGAIPNNPSGVYTGSTAVRLTKILRHVTGMEIFYIVSGGFVPEKMASLEAF